MTRIRREQIQSAGFLVAGFLCLVLAVVKLADGAHWSWWRVFLPLWVMVLHNICYVAIGFVWLFVRVGRRVDDVATRPQGDRLTLQLAAMFCWLGFLDNLLRRIGGPGETAWCWPASGRLEVIALFAIPGLICQVRYWCQAVDPGRERA